MESVYFISFVGYSSFSYCMKEGGVQGEGQQPN